MEVRRGLTRARRQDLPGDSCRVGKCSRLPANIAAVKFKRRSPSPLAPAATRSACHVGVEIDRLERLRARPARVMSASPPGVSASRAIARARQLVGSSNRQLAEAGMPRRRRRVRLLTAGTAARLPPARRPKNEWAARRPPTRQ
jgi:hypothetical protein